MDFIAILDGGRLAVYGSYEEILSRSAALIGQAEVTEDLPPRKTVEFANANEQPDLENSLLVGRRRDASRGRDLRETKRQLVRLHVLRPQCWCRVGFFLGALYLHRGCGLGTRVPARYAVGAQWSLAGTHITSYLPYSPPVLSNLSLSAMSGERVAICGTSESGKLSLIIATLLMMELRGGHITIDDGAALRPRINVTPQEAFFVPGTVRFNIDSYNDMLREGLLVAQDLPRWRTQHGLGGVGMAARRETAAASREGDAGPQQGPDPGRSHEQLRSGFQITFGKSDLTRPDSVDEQTEATMQGARVQGSTDNLGASPLQAHPPLRPGRGPGTWAAGRVQRAGRLLGRQSAFGELYRAHGLQLRGLVSQNPCDWDADTALRDMQEEGSMPCYKKDPEQLPRSTQTLRARHRAAMRPARGSLGLRDMSCPAQHVPVGEAVWSPGCRAVHVSVGRQQDP
ncbi:Oligomycin resistance ATP-dependent permease YOR1 [Tolypocladium ophioglossoides CBS 100239]|uniref:Oligomycin resistance ATP-dependent permease YOR1 n=1 Tax=Tolypocladium ophioglossoides (strain CBS 100239) TaxID=1163406 RepID=A0A0L0NF68_TOLOC|nr:Oligomycin resistance ATP-dependent permease YOR1 [Tolypocladium ophioglossoides CBS 100239]